MNPAAKKSLGESFPLMPSVEFDIILGEWFPIGVCSNYPTQVVENALTVAIASQAGLKSLDYTRKVYIRNTPDFVRGRQDVEIIDFIFRTHKQLYAFVHEITFHNDENIGRILFELTLLRQEFCAAQLVTMANRGALHEGLSVARIQLEQIAWAAAIDRTSDPEIVKKAKAQNCISKLKQLEPRVGRLYGHLSKFAHWDYAAQMEALNVTDEGLAVVLAKAVHKVHLLRIALINLGVILQVVLAHRRDEFNSHEKGEEIFRWISTTAAEIEKKIESLDAALEQHAAEQN